MVSVIIPTYNRAYVIKSSINSILHQTYQDLEVIVVDDGSTDDTEATVKSITDSRVKYIALPKNMGACHARNVGFLHSTGDYIAYQDSDDLWYPHKLERQLKYLEETNADVVIPRACRRFNGSYSIFNHPLDHITMGDTKAAVHRQYLQDCDFATSMVLAKREVFTEFSYDESAPKFQDWDWCTCASKKYKFVYLKEILVENTIMSDSLTVVKNTLNAYNFFYKKHQDEIDADKELSYIWQRRICDCKLLCGEKVTKECFYLLRQKWNTKVFCKAIISLFGVQNLYISLRTKIKKRPVSVKSQQRLFQYELTEDDSYEGRTAYNTGENNADEKSLYGPFVGLYWVWKNITCEDTDYISFRSHVAKYNVSVEKLVESSKDGITFWVGYNTTLFDELPEKVIQSLKVALGDDGLALSVFERMTDGNYRQCHLNPLVFTTTKSELNAFCEFLFAVLNRYKAVDAMNESMSSEYMIEICSLLLSVYLDSRSKKYLPEENTNK